MHRNHVLVGLFEALGILCAMACSTSTPSGVPEAQRAVGSKAEPHDVIPKNPAEGPTAPVDAVASPNEPKPDAGVSAAASPNGEERFFVWVAYQEAKPDAPREEKTYDVGIESSGVRVIETHLGIRLWVDDQLVSLVRKPHRYPRCVCNSDTMEMVCRKGDYVVSSSLQLVRDSKTTLLIAPEKDVASDNSEIDDDIEVVSTIGPYLATRRSFYSEFPCAAHGSWSTMYAWFDLRTGAKLDPLQEMPAGVGIVRQATKALCSEYATCFGDAGMEKDELADCRATVNAIVPFFDGVRFVGRYVTTIDVPYACTDGDNSYARTGSFGKVPLGKRFYGLDTVPKPIASFVKTLPGARLGGISRPPR